MPPQAARRDDRPPASEYHEGPQPASGSAGSSAPIATLQTSLATTFESVAPRDRED
jgi:hypothetical protein